MSEQVQSIVEAVRRLSSEQRSELMQALATVNASLTQSHGDRRGLVDSIKGKYRDVPTSSESFLSRKRADLARESNS